MISVNSKVRDYIIERKLGEGGMGSVYLAEDTMLDRKVAIKVLNPLLTSDQQFTDRFRQEAKVQATLQHSNIISLYNFFQEGENYYMVMEYFAGETLSDRLKQVGLFPPYKGIEIFLQMLGAVDYAHQKGVIHRDIKPSNIMIDKGDNIKIMDFGIAKVVGERGLTKTGTKMGTINYMSPEQILGEKDIDNRSDIFSLGITFFEILTGRLPYTITEESDFKVMQQIVENRIPSVKKYYPYVPDKVDFSIAKATKKLKHERFYSCLDFSEYIKNETKSEEQRNRIDEVLLYNATTTTPDNNQVSEVFDFNKLRSGSRQDSKAKEKVFTKEDSEKQRRQDTRLGCMILIIIGIIILVIIFNT